MASKREQIVLAMMTKLAATAGVSGRVYRSQADPNPRELCPFLTVGWTNETGNPDALQYLYRTLSIEIAVFTRGDVPDTLADPILVDAHQRLTSDPTLGGLAIDITLEDSSNEVLAADYPAARVAQTYSVRFRHPYGSMT